jgi:basic membrane protein A
MKKISILLVLLLVSASCASLFAGGNSEETAIVDDSNKSISVAICLSTGGLGDKNFNDMAYAGLLKAQEEYNITFNYFEPQTSSDFEIALRQFADSSSYDLIIGIGNDMVDAFKEVCPDYPDQKFSIVDTTMDMDNLHSIETRWQDQTFLCGVYAGLGTLSDMPGANEDNTIGVILGMDFPSLQTGVMGFEAGARYVNPTCKVLKVTVGSFNDPAKGKEVAVSMANRGADFIQPIAGASGLGVFNGAKDSGIYAFGVGGNQNYIEPTVIPATSIRNVDEMIYDEVVSVIENKWEPVSSKNGIAEGVVGYSRAQSEVEIPQHIADAIATIESRIIGGDLVICENTDDLENWLSENQYF